MNEITLSFGRLSHIAHVQKTALQKPISCETLKLTSQV